MTLRLYNQNMTQYEADYYQWTRDTAQRLRSGEFGKIELAALIDEVEDLGKWELSAVESRLIVLICHLLKWDYQPQKRMRIWQATIKLQRIRVEKLLNQSPSLRPVVADAVPDIYSEAVLLAVRETGMEETAFPPTCPYTLAEVLLDKEVSLPA